MPYLVEATRLPEVLLLQPKVFSDSRGFFFESFNAREDRKSTRLNSSHSQQSRMPSSA